MKFMFCEATLKFKCDSCGCLYEGVVGNVNAGQPFDDEMWPRIVLALAANWGVRTSGTGGVICDKCIAKNFLAGALK